MAYIGKNPRLKSIVSQGDTLANLTAEPRVAGRLVYATDEEKFYFDNGTDLVEVGSGAGGGVPLLAKGGLITSDGSNNGELTVGADGQILSADSAEVSGLKWIDPPSSGGDTYALGKLFNTTFFRLAAVNLWKINSNGNAIIIGTDSGVGYCYRSVDDGLTFSQVTTGLPASHSCQDIFVANNNRFILSGRNTTNTKGLLRYSDDNGLTWTEPTFPDVAGTKFIVSITSNGTRLLATCYNDVSPANGSGILYSDDNGTNWSFVTLPQLNTWTGAAYGNGVFTVVSRDGTNRVATSPDGITWTLRTAASALPWGIVQYGNNIFVATSESGTTQRIMTSPDGITWTLRTHPSMAGFSGVVEYFPTYKVFIYLAGYSTGCMYSHNGITWVSLTTFAENVANIALHKGRFLISHTFNASGARVTYTHDLNASEL